MISPCSMWKKVFREDVGEISVVMINTQVKQTGVAWHINTTRAAATDYFHNRLICRFSSLDCFIVVPSSI